jgi:hypothetical protein
MRKKKALLALVVVAAATPAAATIHPCYRILVNGDVAGTQIHRQVDVRGPVINAPVSLGGLDRATVIIDLPDVDR